MICLTATSYAGNCHHLELDSINEVYIYHVDREDEGKYQEICKFALEIDLILETITSEIIKIEPLSLSIPYREGGASYNDGGIITIPLQGFKDSKTRVHLRSKHEQKTIFLHELGHSVASSYLSSQINEYMTFKNNFAQKASASYKLYKMHDESLQLGLKFKNCMGKNTEDYCINLFAKDFELFEARFEKLTIEESYYKELCDSKPMRDFGLSVKPYHEFFADVFTVLLRRDLSSMSDSFEYSGMSVDEKYRAEIRSLSTSFEVNGWVDEEAYAVLAPARSFVGSKIKRLGQLSNKEISDVIYRVLIAISDEVSSHILSSNQKPKSPQQMNEDLIGHLDALL
jgi:hypothetical protein